MMATLGIMRFHHYLKNELRICILEKYWNLDILSEADLQAVVWQLVSEFLKVHDPEGAMFNVLNKPFLKNLHVHPDIIVFRHRKPWVVIELKESKLLKPKTAQRERVRLLKSREAFHAKRGYLLYVARYGEGKVIHGPKGAGAHYFFEIPIVLQSVHTLASIKKWEKEFKYWSKYTGDGDND